MLSRGDRTTRPPGPPEHHDMAVTRWTSRTPPEPRLHHDHVRGLRKITTGAATGTATTLQAPPWHHDMSYAGTITTRPCAHVGQHRPHGSPPDSNDHGIPTVDIHDPSFHSVGDHDKQSTWTSRTGRTRCEQDDHSMAHRGQHETASHLYSTNRRARGQPQTRHGHLRAWTSQATCHHDRAYGVNATRRPPETRQVRPIGHPDMFV